MKKILVLGSGSEHGLFDHRTADEVRTDIEHRFVHEGDDMVRVAFIDGDLPKADIAHLMRAEESDGHIDAIITDRDTHHLHALRYGEYGAFGRRTPVLLFSQHHSATELDQRIYRDDHEERLHWYSRLFGSYDAPIHGLREGLSELHVTPLPQPPHQAVDNGVVSHAQPKGRRV